MQSYSEGIFCSAQCRDNAAETAQRAAVIAKADRELADWQQRRMAIKGITLIGTGMALYFGWDMLPPALTDQLEALWKALRGFVKAGLP